MVRDGVTKGTDTSHAFLALENDVLEPAVQVELRVPAMPTTPLPEVVLNFRNIRSSGNVLDGLIVNGDHGRADERLTVKISELDFDLCRGTGLVTRFVRKDFDVQDPLLRGNNNFTCLLVDLSSADSESFDKEVRHVLLGDINFSDGTLTVNADDSWWQINAVRGAQEQGHCAVLSFRIDHQFDCFPGLIFFLVTDNFNVIEAELFAIKSFAPDHKDISSLDAMPCLVLERVTETVLALGRGLELLLDLAILARVNVPGSDRFFVRLSFIIVLDL